MRAFLLLSLLLALAPQGQKGLTTGGDPPVAVLGFKWAKSRQTVSTPQVATDGTAQGMIPQNKNFERNAREQAPAGVRDPNLDTIDGRHAAIEKSVQESRTAKSDPVEGYTYRVRVRNAGAKQADVIFWEYRFADAADPSAPTRRQFLCGVQIKPGKEKELQAFGLAGPSRVVNAASASAASAGTYQESAVVNRVEFSDGTIWQREGWNYAEVRGGVARATSTPWGNEMCRAL